MQSYRNWSTYISSNVRYKAAYEGEGKTTVRVINQEQDLGLMIDSYATVSETMQGTLIPKRYTHYSESSVKPTNLIFSSVVDYLN